MEKLRKYAEQLNISLSDGQLARFETYYRLLIEKNKVMNLTAITEKDDVILKHFADSLAIYPAVSVCQDWDHKALRLIDIGTGAGFPGIPLKIAFPELSVVLYDSLNKRIVFLEEVIAALGLQDITAVHGRAEEGGKDKMFREQFDFCVSRAVANLSTLSEYCLPFVKKNGYFIAYKSADISEETKTAQHAIRILGGLMTDISTVTLPSSDIKRNFVTIQKVKPTPKNFPRKPGTASKQPL